MAATTGVNAVVTYDGATNAAKIDQLLAAIPDPDAPHGTGAVAGGGNLDEMSPGAAAQLRVELEALKAALI